MRSRRRTEILTTAAELFARKGFAGTTVRDIADASGILSGSLYHHFSAKEEMVEEIFTAYFDELAAQWDAIRTGPGDTGAMFEAMLRAAVLNVAGHTAAARLLTHEWLDLRHIGDVERRWREIERTWLDMIREGIAQGELRSDIDPAFLFGIAMDVVRGLSGWYHEGGRYSIETVSEAYVGVVMAGVASPRDGHARLPGHGRP